ncbi:hypothetical protein HYN59_12850 [Flavobacterium album]|uniref:Uncharacterized protein n=1 Tax=Flavobacterium album TaxID=2175091 RepID=A0A2S1QZV5_9FLAO|nr:hypothetical protein [Flavobacterium album]AWH85940.1 hypothetical protein HYN59_12850 [Flavobacterium album]
MIFIKISIALINITGTIKTYEKDTFEFVSEGICNKDMALQPPDIDAYDKMVLESKFYKDFLDGEVDYFFRYKITGREEVYDSIQAMLTGL